MTCDLPRLENALLAYKKAGILNATHDCLFFAKESKCLRIIGYNSTKMDFCAVNKIKGLASAVEMEERAVKRLSIY